MWLQRLRVQGNKPGAVGLGLGFRALRVWGFRGLGVSGFRASGLRVFV